MATMDMLNNQSDATLCLVYILEPTLILTQQLDVRWSLRRPSI